MRLKLVTALLLLLCASLFSFAQSQDELLEYALKFENASANMTFVLGSDMSGAEEALLALMKARYPLLNNMTYVDDSPKTEAWLNNSNATIVLIGGPAQNRISRKYLQAGWFTNESLTIYQEFTVRNGRTPKGATLLLFSDVRGFANLYRQGLQYSPLSAIMPEAYVPIAATGISALFLSLWGLVRTWLERLILGAGKKGKKPKPAPLLLGINVREVLSAMASCTVIAIAITWVFAGPTWGFIPLFFVNLFVALFTIIGHELIHLMFSRMMGLKTEYTLWYSGSVFTLVSAFLGNPFGVAGFLVEEKTPETRRRFGVMKLSAPIASILIASFFAVVNLFFPWDVFQMIYMLSSMLAMVEIMPFEPLDGHDIFNWNVFVWFFSFCFISAAYLTINFVI